MLISDIICGKGKRGTQNGKKSSEIRLIYSKSSMCMGILKLHSSSLCGYLAQCLFWGFISRRMAGD